MGRLMVHITQFRNLTQWSVGFCVSNGVCLNIRDLPPGDTRNVKQSRILRCCRDQSTDWKISIWINGRFTGMELSPLDVLDCSRIIINDEWEGYAVICVEGVREKKSDYLLRLLFFGCLRDIFWDKRPSFLIARADSSEAVKLRQITSRTSPVPVLSTKGNKPVESSVHPPGSVVTTTDDGVESHRSSLYFSSEKNSSTDDSHESPDSDIEEPNPLNSHEKNSPPNFMEPRPRNEKSIPLPPRSGVGVISPDHRAFTYHGEEIILGRNRANNRYLPREPMLHNPMDGFVHVILLLLAFILICYLRFL